MRPSLLALVIIGLVACTRRDPPSSTTPPPVASADAEAPPSATPATPPVADAALPAHGTATLVLQKVSTECGAGSGQRVHLLGTDVFVLLESGDAGAKPDKEFPFCASHDKNGKPRAPQLQIWQNCSAFPSCEVAVAESANGKVEVTCGKEHVTLESDGTHTILRGSFGEREVAPHPMNLMPVKTESRRAFVDC